MTDPTLFEVDVRPEAHAHRGDPGTSAEAARTTDIRGQALQVLRAYEHVVAGLTDEAAYVRAGLGVQSARRCSDLRHAGLIERVAGVRGRTSAGKAATVSRITAAGVAVLEALEHG